MNTRRVIFWLSFIVVIVLIIWGLVVAMGKDPNPTGGLASPAQVTDPDNILGRVDAPLTLIEYSDFQCPACRAYSLVISKLLIEASSTLRVVYRHYPLPQHNNAVQAALAAESAGNQGKFKDMYELLFLGQYDWSEMPNPSGIFLGYAEKIGLDIERFKADVNASTTLAKINSQKAEGDSIGIRATPTFFLNGKAINNPQSYEEFKAIIDEAASSAQ